MQESEAASQGQPQAGTLLTTAMARVDLVKLLEQVRLIRLRDTYAGVGDGDLDAG